MFIMSRSLIVKAKLDRLTNGYNAYAETDEVIQIMKREISKLDIPVICDESEQGCWFIPDTM